MTVSSPGNHPLRLGFALTGSFCTFAQVMEEFKKIAALPYQVFPIMSYNAYQTDTRFGRAADFVQQLEQLSGHTVIHTIEQAEPIGPQKLLDALVVAPCTGNTLAKLANGIADTPVTMAVKSHLRNNRPVILAVSTNDALGAAAKNIGALLPRRNIYFVPMGQDHAEGKPTSVVADFSQLLPTITAAMEGCQLQPVLLGCYQK